MDGELLLAGRPGQPVDLGADLAQRAIGDVLHHEHGEALLGGGADTEVDVVLDDQLLPGLVHVGVEVGVLAERRHQRLGDERQVAKLRIAPRGELLVEPGAQSAERLGVALLDEGEVRGGELASHHRLGNALAQAADGNALLAAGGRRALRRWSADLRRRLLLLLDVREDVVLHHPAERP